MEDSSSSNAGDIRPEEYRRHIEDARRRSVRKLFVGTGATVLGLAITLGSYAAACSAGGGVYVITFGLVIVGVATIIHALVRLAGYSREAEKLGR